MLAFVSGPPGTNYAVMKRAFDEGWGGVIAKTVSVDSSKVCWLVSCATLNLGKFSAAAELNKARLRRVTRLHAGQQCYP